MRGPDLRFWSSSYDNSFATGGASFRSVACLVTTSAGAGAGENILVRAQDVYKVYRGSSAGSEDVPVLDRVSFIVRRGEFVAVIGPSGCGKSTLLNVLAGLTTYEGMLTLGNERIVGPGTDRAVVFQSASLLPWRNVERNAMYGLELRRALRRSDARSLARETLAQVGLKGFEKHYPHQISGGMQQRVNIARALVVNPELILMDEPFGALDAMTREDLQEQLSNLFGDIPRTTVFITHDIGEALYLADRILVMSGRPGRIVADIPVPFERPRERSLTGTVEFDALEGRVRNLLHPDSRTRPVDQIEKEKEADYEDSRTV